jgi:cell division ATPase FtsA
MAIPVLSRFTKPKDPGLLLLIDLGTHSVKTSMVQLPSALEQEPKVLGSSQHPLSRTMMRGRLMHDLDGILGVIAQTVEQVSISAGKEPADIVLGMSGNSVQYSGLTIRLQRPKPDEPITQKELDQLLQRIEQETATTAWEKLEKQSPPWSHLGAIITDYRIDDTLVSTPLDLTGTTIECVVLHGFWDDQSQKVVDLIGNQLGLEISMVWETAVARTLQKRQERESFVLVDIGGRVTEAVLVKNRRVVKNVTVNIGSDDWTDWLANDLQVNYSQAQRLKESFQEGTLDQDRAARAREILEEEITNVMTALVPMLKKIDNEKSLPPVLYFAGEGTKLDLLKSKVLTFPWNKEGLFPNFPHVERIQEQFLNESLYYGYDLLS